MPLESNGWGAEPAMRVFGGASLSERSGRLKTSLLRCRGESWGLRCLAVDALTLPAPKQVGTELAAAIADALGQLAQHCDVPLAAVDALGLDGLPAGPTGPLAALVAERTGVTVAAGFSDRDHALGGRGGPLSPLPDWLLFRSSKLYRLLLHLGPTLLVTLLPPAERPSKILCFDAGPCCAFLDGLVCELSQNKVAFDPSGHFAVQGRISEELVNKWMSHPFLLRPPPKFLGSRDFDTSFRQASLAFAREHRLSARDVLCSANQFVVRVLRDALRRFLPSGFTVDEAWVSGGGTRNGFLWKLLRDGLAPLPVARTDEAGIPSEARPAIHAALLAYFTMENLPGNLPALSGAAAARILGQITPGSPENWDRWVCHLADRFDLHHERAA